jgi:tetratricopeptide (TPR) repeat protein
VGAFSQNTEIQPDRVEGLRLYALILTITGYCHFYFNHSQVRGKFVEGQSIIDQLLDQGYEARFEKAWSLFFQGVFEQQFGDRSIVEGILVECFSLSREIKNDWLVLCSLGWLADLACQTGNQEQAQIWSASILDEARAQNNITGEAGALIAMGDVYRFFGENEKALKVYKKGLDIYLSQNQFQEASTALFQLGFLNLSMGFLEAMTVRLRQGATLLIKHDLPHHAINILVCLGMTLWARGDLVKASETFEESLSLSQQYACNPSIFATTANAEYLAIMGAYQQADEQLQNLKTLPEELLTERFLRGKFLSGYFRQILGWIALGEGRYAEASDHFKRSIRIFRSIKSRESEAYAKAQLARAEFGLGNKRTAHNLLKEALETEIEIPGYVAMIFTLPIALLILVEEEYAFTQKVYQQIRSDPFMGKAQIFEDLVYQHLPEKIRCFPISKAANTPEHHNALWNTARLVLSALSENP